MPAPTVIDRNKFLACLVPDEQRERVDAFDRMMLAVLLAHSQTNPIPITDAFVAQVRLIWTEQKYPATRKAFEARLTGDSP